MVPSNSPIIAIGYKYNSHTVIYFISKQNTGIKKVAITYLYNHPDQFYNVDILPVARTLFMSKLFGYTNEVESHKKPSQSDLALEKYWVTQCGEIKLCTAVATEMDINSFYKIFFYGIKRYHYEKLIGMRELLELLALDCFNNHF